MTTDKAIATLARLYGILDRYTDMQSKVHHATPDTQRALLRANGIAVDTPEQVRAALADRQAQDAAAYVPGDVIVEAGKGGTVSLARPASWCVLSEADESVLAEGRDTDQITLPDLPDGVHRLRLEGETGVQEANLIAAPPHAPSLRAVTGHDRTWGVMAALYGLDTGAGKPLGDYEDLAHLARIAGRQGAGFVGINPVHALGRAATDTISPYSPAHRGFLNTDHIAVADQAAGRSDGDMRDYVAHRRAQQTALKAEFAAFEEAGDPDVRAAFEGFCRDGGTRLQDFARYEVLSLTHGADTRRWPAGADDKEFTPQDTAFHMWLQWRADTQLAAAQRTAREAGVSLGLYLDLAVGARLGAAESWGAHTAAAIGVSLGAPPDQLSPAGQNWQITGLSPHKLQHAAYDDFRFILRQNMRHCGLLRIDHALGLYRSFWLPEDGSPGGYIRQPFEALMAIIAIEAQRAGTLIVGEDLGLVPEGFRDEMAARGLYGYSVLQFEKDADGDFLPAERLRAQSLACFGTHDTPTLAGFWQARDIAWWERLGWIQPQDAAQATDRRTQEKRQLAGLAAPAPLPAHAGPGLRDTVHATLASSPAALVAVQLDDILCLEDAQNLPGTVADHPNWLRRYPQSLEDIDAGPDLRKTAAIMARAGRAERTGEETT